MNTVSPIGTYVLVGAFLLASAGLSLATHQSHGSPVFAGGKSSGGCPSVHAIGNFQQSSVVGASIDKGASTWTFYFTSLVNLGPTSGVPGLIEYCVYPNGTLPGSSTVSAVGADGSSFVTLTGTHQGFFGFGRATGDPSNVPLNGAQNILMGTGTWSTTPPANQTILVHINDAAECQALYGGSSSTCFVLPNGEQTPLCGGSPSCKTATVAEANATNASVVPANTRLHIHYTYTIDNAFANGFNMELRFPLSIGANFTGVRDFFNCTQSFAANGTPGPGGGTFPNYEGTGFTLFTHHISPYGNCSSANLAIRLSATSATIVLHPGQSISWTLDTVTGKAGFSGTGWHCLNYGVTVIWYQSNDGLIHHYTSPDVDVWTW